MKNYEWIPIGHCTAWMDHHFDWIQAAKISSNCKIEENTNLSKTLNACRFKEPTGPVKSLKTLDPNVRPTNIPKPGHHNSRPQPQKLANVALSSHSLFLFCFNLLLSVLHG